MGIKTEGLLKKILLTDSIAEIKVMMEKTIRPSHVEKRGDRTLFSDRFEFDTISTAMV